jgi:hypothetical protein
VFSHFNGWTKNGAVRRISGLKRNVRTRGRTKLHNEELYNLYISPNFIGVINSRNIGCLVHVACMSNVINAYRNLKERDHVKDVSAVDGENTTEMNLQREMYEDAKWIQAGQYRV